MPTETRDGRPGQGTAAVEPLALHSTRTLAEPTAPHRHRRPVVAVGELHRPGGRRRQWVLIVRRCPACEHLHLHRTERPAARTWPRTGSCGTRYTVVRVVA